MTAMFDYIKCYHGSLPYTRHSGYEFQTKDLSCGQDTYEISKSGQLQLTHIQQYDEQSDEDSKLAKPLAIPYTGPINFYAYVGGTEWIEYRAMFATGQLQEIRIYEYEQAISETISNFYSWMQRVNSYVRSIS